MSEILNIQASCSSAVCSSAVGMAQGVELALMEVARKLGVVVSKATHVDEVIAALYILASLLRDIPLQKPAFDFINTELCALEELAAASRDKASAASASQPKEVLFSTFYGGATFAAVSKLLLSRIALDWLALFPATYLSLLFDDFYYLAPPNSAVLALVPALVIEHLDSDVEIGVLGGCIQAERLLVDILVNNGGVKQMALSFAGELGHHGKVRATSSNCAAWKLQMQMPKGNDIIQAAQLVSSIPDRARPKASLKLRSPAFFQSITGQLLLAAKARWDMLCSSQIGTNDGTFLFIGEVFGRLCRRGHADLLVSEVLPALTLYVEDMKKNVDTMTSTPGAVTHIPNKMAVNSYWQILILSIKDHHATERFCESMLRKMAGLAITDDDAYSILWTLFSDHKVIRNLFQGKFLLWKIFPFRCLKWILDFAVLHYPAVYDKSENSEKPEDKIEKDVIKHLAEAWSEKAFVCSASLDQQAYLTAALGLTVKAMTKDDVLNYGSILHCLLEGVSCRLESPIYEVRSMAKQVAYAFSSIINPGDPLILEDDDNVKDLSKWETGTWQDPVKTDSVAKESQERMPMDDADKKQNDTKPREKERRLAFEDNDPDAPINLMDISVKGWVGKLTNESSESGSESESDSSLQPYDMSDDECDLENIPRQLSTCAAYMRKGDDPNAVERALQASERLIRANPDELENVAADLASALVHVRCSSIAVEGEEDTLEEKRHRALVAILVCSPLNVIEILTRELFSAHVDTSQRLLILDVMSDAARELAHDVTNQRNLLVGNPSGAGPWKAVSLPAWENSLVNWTEAFERSLPLKSDQKEVGKSRRWGVRSMQIQKGRGEMPSKHAYRNRFAPLASLFMFPVMHGYDKRRHGVDLLGNDFVVLGRLIVMLGVCIECISQHPDVATLGMALLDMLKSRPISGHAEPYVRRSVLYALSRVLIAIHPESVLTGLNETEQPLIRSLEWIREWVADVVANDGDNECSTMAMGCLQLHSELAHQITKSMENRNRSTTMIWQ